MFDFPEGIGPVECVNVEHEEVLLIPRWVQADRVTFKYGLGNEFIEVLRTLHKLGLDRTTPVQVGGVSVSPARRGGRVPAGPGRAGPADDAARPARAPGCAASTQDGAPREVYLYHVVDNEWSMREYGHQAVSWQTAINPVVALELLASGRVVGQRGPRPGGLRRRPVPGPAEGLRLPLGHALGPAR